MFFQWPDFACSGESGLLDRDAGRSRKMELVWKADIKRLLGFQETLEVGMSKKQSYAMLVILED